MRRFLAGLGLSVLVVAAPAQEKPPAFEVASVKPAAPQPQGRMMVRMGGDAGRVDYSNVSLKDVLARAYGVKRYQINGPGWLESERYDITAKVPDGVNPDQVPAMLQVLLAERFKMAAHKETKEQSVYALIPGKGGPKLTKSEIETKPDAKPPVGPDGRPMPRGGRGMIMMQVGAPASSTAQMKAIGITMAAFSDMLSNMLDRPVVDQTGIQGNYDITLDVSMEDLGGLRKMPGPPPGAGGPGMEHAPAEGGGAASIFTSIQTLGLKLDARKAPIEYVVVDSAEKVPTEN